MTCIKCGTMARRRVFWLFTGLLQLASCCKAACALKLTLCRLIWYSCSSHGAGKTFCQAKWQRCQVAAAVEVAAAATPLGRTRLGKVWKIKIPQLAAAAASAALPVLCCVFPLIWSHVNDKSQQRQLAWQFSSAVAAAKAAAASPLSRLILVPLAAAARVCLGEQRHFL